MMVSVLLPAAEVALLSTLVGRQLETVLAGVVSARLHLEDAVVEFVSEEEGSEEGSQSFGNVSRVAVRLNPERPYEQDARPVASNCGLIKEIHIARTAISLSQTKSLKAVTFEEEDEAMGLPSFSYKWQHPLRTDEGGAGLTPDLAEADVGLLFQTTSGQSVWVYAPFGPYLGTAIYDVTAGSLLPEELAEVVELVPVSGRAW
jgi:hypothetical protein